jgi:hypothetical protein
MEFFPENPEKAALAADHQNRVERRMWNECPAYEQHYTSRVQ